MNLNLRLTAVIIAALGTLHCASGGDEVGGASAGGSTSRGGSTGKAGGSGGNSNAGTGGSGAGTGGNTQGGAGGAAGGTGGTAGGTGGTAGSGGNTGGTGGTGIGGIPGVNTNPGFPSLAPTMGAPLDRAGTTLTPPAPQGWTWYQIDGAVCRDGSPAGFFVRYKDPSDQLLFYLEGGGACTSPNWCLSNPANVNVRLAGDGQSGLTSVGGTVAPRQEPGTAGIFDTANASNPFKDWNMIYVPYCTGDVFFGTRKDATIPGVAEKQQFVGYPNMQKFVARIVPTFKDKVKRVVFTGASAGGFGAALNFSMVQDAFGSSLVLLMVDSAPPFADTILPVCMQKKWRETWGFKDSMPADCTECQQADGGGLVNIPFYLARKHGNFRGVLVSSMQDEIIRLFYQSSLNNCAAFDTAGPVDAWLVGGFPGPEYTKGLTDLRSRYGPTGRFATYYLAGPNEFFHQHTWRPRFYEAAAGGQTIAQFVSNFLGGKIEQAGP